MQNISAWYSPTIILRASGKWQGVCAYSGVRSSVLSELHEVLCCLPCGDVCDVSRHTVSDIVHGGPEVKMMWTCSRSLTGEGLTSEPQDGECDGLQKTKRYELHIALQTLMVES